MEDLSPAPGSPALDDNTAIEGNDDPQDPLRPEIEEEDSAPTPPIAEPTQDMDAVEDAPIRDADEDEDMSANDSDALSEVDEAQFADFDPNAIQIEDRPVAVDETNVGLLGVHKRKRTEAEEAERKKKKKEGRREKPKKSKKRVDDEDDFEGGVEIDGKRVRKSKAGADGVKQKARRARTPENEDNLSPEERRRRALDRKMDEALRSHRAPARRGKGIDLDAQADTEIDDMRKRMTAAAEADSKARDQGQIATHKLTLLPEVVELLNRNNISGSLVDPDINLLEAVRFFLEPLPQDGSLPAYQIQRELFAALAKLSIGKDALIASGIGKVVIFYTKSTRPEPGIKRQAEKLIGEWTRPILKKRNDYRGKEFREAAYDPSVLPVRASQPNPAAIAAAKRKAALSMPVPGNRARVEGGVGTYNVVPRNNLSNAMGVGTRKLGTAGEEQFRKIKMRGLAKTGGGGSRR